MPSHLNQRMRDLLARQEMMFVATSGARGEADCVFRSGPPGFVRVLGPRRLAWPEYRRGGAAATLCEGRVRLLFVDFFRDVVGLQINGYASVAGNAAGAAHPGLAVCPLPDRRAERWISVYVEDACLLHPTALPRGGSELGGVRSPAGAADGAEWAGDDRPAPAPIGAAQ